ncbi:Cupin domain protein [Azotobacter beijerinckii]|uniref:Cupin domain protein n=2 Tax=Azotobacter beijerinckii TaxID=170623 RepID=A0A1H6ZN78_9GAMM|nr:Cupin domain protein [Azotobacter beijerinckii]SEJ53614.1 Cupin domain protein [Azotobacter beijerinckii]
MTMKRPFQATLLLAQLCAGAALADSDGIKVVANGSQASMAGPADYFSGNAVVDMLFTPTEYSQVSGAHVTFAPGARTAWHTHPRGQTLIVTSGKGWVQEWGKDKQEIHPGDVVRIAPGVKHWHGATASNGMRHIALQEAVDGKNVEWLEQVGDDQYAK